MGRILKHFRKFFITALGTEPGRRSIHVSPAFASIVRKINRTPLLWPNNFGRVIRMQINGGSYHV